MTERRSCDQCGGRVWPRDDRCMECGQRLVADVRTGGDVVSRTTERDPIAEAVSATDYVRRNEVHTAAHADVWATCVVLCIAVLVAAVWIGASLRGEATDQRNWREAEAQKSRNTIDYMDSFLSTGRGAGTRTDAQRKASWDWEFGGQWVRWEGVVVSVTGRDPTCSVSLRVSPQTLTSDTTFDLERRIAVTLNQGQRVRFEGRLADHSAFGYRLTDVRILEK